MATNFVLLTEDELENFLDCDSENTNKLTKYAVNRLEAFAKCVGLNSLEDVDHSKADGIHKYFLAKEIDTNAENFQESQQSFKAMSQKLTREGKGFVHRASWNGIVFPGII